MSFLYASGWPEPALLIWKTKGASALAKVLPSIDLGATLLTFAATIGGMGHLRAVQVSWGEFFPLAGGSATVEAEQGSAVEHDVTDLDHSLQAHKLVFVHFITAEQLDIVAKIPQEPVQLPERFWIAVEPTGDDVIGKPVWLKNDHAHRVVRLRGLPPVEDPLHPNQKNSVGNLVGGAAIGSIPAPPILRRIV